MLDILNDPEIYLIDLKSRFDNLDLNKYYLSYSGGKDSHFLYWFLKEYMHDSKVQIVALNTRMEHPEIRARMYKYADIVLLPDMMPHEVKEKYGSPCFSKIQDDFINRYQKGCRSKSLMDRIMGKRFIGNDGKEYKSTFNLNKTAKELLLSGKLHKISPMCCTILKKKALKKYEKQSGRKAIIGIRSTEGALRKSKYHQCIQSDGKFAPLYDLSDDLLDAIYKKYNIEIPKIYNYIARTGCMGCPYGSYMGDTKAELDLLTDAQRKYVIELFKESYDVLKIDYSYRQEKLEI